MEQLGVITGRYKSPADLEKEDMRLFLPRFSEENFAANLTVVDRFKSVANKHKATAGQIALAWILARQPGFVPIPGTTSVERLEENTAAVHVKLDGEDLRLLNEAWMRRMLRETDFLQPWPT